GNSCVPRKAGRHFRNLEQPGAIIGNGGAPSFKEEDCFVSSRPVAKICFQPIDEAAAVMDVPRLHCPFEAMRIAVGAGRECRRKPALQSQERRRWETALLITHD